MKLPGQTQPILRSNYSSGQEKRTVTLSMQCCEYDERGKCKLAAPFCPLSVPSTPYNARVISRF